MTCYDMINICMRKAGLGLVMWEGILYVTSLFNISKGKHYLLRHISLSFILWGDRMKDLRQLIEIVGKIMIKCHLLASVHFIFMALAACPCNYWCLSPVLNWFCQPVLPFVGTEVGVESALIRVMLTQIHESIFFQIPNSRG